MSKPDRKQRASYSPKTPCPQCGIPKTAISELCRCCAAAKRRGLPSNSPNRYSPPPAGYVALTTAVYDLRLCRESILYHIKRGRLHAEKRDNRWWIKESELRRWLGTDNPDAVKAGEVIEADNAEISLIRWPKIPEPIGRVSLNTPDIDFLVGELRQKISYLESENRRLEDQNLRFRNIIRDELALWSGVVNDGQALSYGKAKRHINTLLGATNYNGRSESPLEYREPSTGGNLRAPYERLCRGETDESEKPPTEPTIIDLEPRPQYIPDPQGIRSIVKSRKNTEGRISR